MYKKTSALGTMKRDDNSFTEVFLSLRSLGEHYGLKEDEEGKTSLDSFGTTFKNVFNDRITTPIKGWAADPKACFFTPYQNTFKAGKGLVLGVAVPILTLLTGLGVIVINSTLTNALCGLFSLPAMVELVAGIASLLMAGWHQGRAFINRKDENTYKEAKDMAQAYALDAAVRIAMVIPLAVASFVFAIPDVVRFITRTIATMIYGFSDPKVELTTSALVDPVQPNQSQATVLNG